MKSFWALHDCYSEAGEPKTALGVFQTNAMAAGEMSGLFTVGARFNHSCKPTVNRVWVHSGQTQMFIVTQPVERGQELCIYYIDPKCDRKARQDQLQRDFNFDCRCESCCLTGVAQINSDNLRREYQNLDDSIPKLANDPAEAIEKVLRILEIIQEEFDGDPHMAKRAFYDGWQMAKLAGDTDLAALMSERAREAKLLAEGNVGDTVEPEKDNGVCDCAFWGDRVLAPPEATRARGKQTHQRSAQFLSKACSCKNVACSSGMIVHEDTRQGDRMGNHKGGVGVNVDWDLDTMD